MKSGETLSIPNMKHIIKITIIAIIALGVSLGLWFYLNKYLLRSKAAGEGAKLKFSNISVNGVAITGAIAKANEGDEVRVDLILTIDGALGMSGVDLVFANAGGNLDFLYTKTITNLPVGFDDRVIEEAGMTLGAGPKQLKRVMFVALKPSAQLQKSIIVPLYFKVFTAGQTSTLSVDFASSLVVGPPNRTYPISIETTSPPNLTVQMHGAKAAPATNLACDVVANSSRANCGRGVTFMWSDSSNEDGYRIYRNNQLIQTLGKDTTRFTDPRCQNFDANSYMVMAYNEAGNNSQIPSVLCACQICPTHAPLPPTPTLPPPPPNSADLAFRLIFPNAESTVNTINNVKITIFDAAGKSICDDKVDCTRVVTFLRVPGARVENTFQSPPLQYPLQKYQAYTVVVKQNNTVQQTYKYVYLRWQQTLQCLEGHIDTGCGQLTGEVASRPLISGDLDGSNVIDQKDKDILNGAMIKKSNEGDLNFDGTTDQNDLTIFTKNINKKGT